MPTRRYVIRNPSATAKDPLVRIADALERLAAVVEWWQRRVSIRAMARATAHPPTPNGNDHDSAPVA